MFGHYPFIEELIDDVIAYNPLYYHRLYSKMAVIQIFFCLHTYWPSFWVMISKEYVTRNHASMTNLNVARQKYIKIAAIFE